MLSAEMAAALATAKAFSEAARVGTRLNLPSRVELGVSEDYSLS